MPKPHQRTFLRYSRAFKQKVVDEIEAGEVTIAKAKQIYDISGSNTIQKWLKEFGKNHLLNRVIRVEMKNEKDKFKEQEKKIKELQAALSEAHLQLIKLHSTIKVMEEEGSEKKKTFTK
jgi:transposase-like protein